jgi:hypothetical protein
MKRVRSRRFRGATLVEAIMAAAAFTLMLSGLVAVGTSSLSSWSYGSSKMTADNDASLALQQMVTDGRRGIRAYTNSTFDQLTVVLPSVNSQGDYVRTTEGTSVKYYLLNKILYRQEGAATAVAIGKKITNVRFAVDGVQIGIWVTAKQQNGSNIGITTLTSQTSMRNPSY